MNEHTPFISDRLFSTIDTKIRVFHIGGRGAMGPVECLLQLGESMALTIFEANIDNSQESSSENTWGKYEQFINDYAHRFNVEVSFVPKGISNYPGTKKFYINVMPDCSSLLKIHQGSAKYQRNNGPYRIIWGEICKPKRTVDIEVTSLDELHAIGEIPLPHFLSMDIQGAEYDAFEGTLKALHGDLLGIVTEVEFHELYEGQKLFCDQFSLLRKHRFILFDLLNSEHWYSGPILGKGCLMVSEALFLRDFQYFVNKDNDDPITLLSNLSKLAIVAFCFDRKSYAFEILEYILNNWYDKWDMFLKQNNTKYLHGLMTFYNGAKTVKQKEENEVPTYEKFMTKVNHHTIPTICPHCDESLFISGKGSWVCPYCKKIFVIDEPTI